MPAKPSRVLVRLISPRLVFRPQIPGPINGPFTGDDYHHGWLVATSAAGVIYGFALLVG